MSEDEKNNPTTNIPVRDILFVDIPSGGFQTEELQKYIRAGYSVWGTVPLVNKPSSIILVDNEPKQCLVLRLETNHIPINLLAHHIVVAGENKKGLNHLTDTFFGMTFGALRKGLQDAREKANGRG